jgi:hypothetical protein
MTPIRINTAPMNMAPNAMSVMVDVTGNVGTPVDVDGFGLAEGFAVLSDGVGVGDVLVVGADEQVRPP